MASVLNTTLKYSNIVVWDTWLKIKLSFTDSPFLLLAQEKVYLV